MVKHLSGSLVDVTYIFDEPSVGLHPRDVHRLNELLQKLRDNGNTVIVVEHDADVIKVADHIVDVGPQAGSNGGQVVLEGTPLQIIHVEQSIPLHGHSMAHHVICFYICRLYLNLAIPFLFEVMGRNNVHKQ